MWSHNVNVQCCIGHQMQCVCMCSCAHFCQYMVDGNCLWQGTKSIPTTLHLSGSAALTTWMKCTLHISSLRHSISSCFLGQNSAVEDQCKMTGKLLMLFTSKWDWRRPIMPVIQGNIPKWVVPWVIRLQYFYIINILRSNQYCFFNNTYNNSDNLTTGIGYAVDATVILFFE